MALCTAEGCASPHVARGYCDRHYAIARKAGEFQTAGTDRVCEVYRCGKAHAAHGLCQRHYNLRERGTAFNVLSPDARCLFCESEPIREGLCIDHLDAFQIVSQQPNIDDALEGDGMRIYTTDPLAGRARAGRDGVVIDRQAMADTISICDRVYVDKLAGAAWRAALDQTLKLHPSVNVSVIDREPTQDVLRWYELHGFKALEVAS